MAIVGTVVVSVLAIVLDFVVHADKTVIFVVSAAAILGLAWVVGLSTERLGSLTGPQVGGILNATFGNIAELIISFFALQAGLIEVVKASLTGSIIGNLLLVLGASVLLGGLRHGTQSFSPRIAGSNAALLVVAAHRPVRAGGLRRDVEQRDAGDAHRGIGPGRDRADHRLRPVAGLPVRQPVEDPRRPRRAGRPRGADVERRVRRSSCCCSRPRCSRSSRRSWSIRSTTFTDTLGLSFFFVGVVIIPTIGNLAEHLVAVQLALKDKMEFAMAVTYGSSLQVALFVAPVLVLLGVLIGQPMNLVFTPLEVAAVARGRRDQRAHRPRWRVELARGRAADDRVRDPRGVVLRVRLSRGGPSSARGPAIRADGTPHLQRRGRRPGRFRPSSSSHPEPAGVSRHGGPGVPVPAQAPDRGARPRWGQGGTVAVLDKEFTYAPPGMSGSPVPLKERYDNFIGGRWVAPVKGGYSGRPDPGDGQADHRGAALDRRGRRAGARRRARRQGRMGRACRRPSAARVLNAIAEVIDANSEMLAVAESWENGKPVRETLAADIPLAADHFRYFASVIRAEEGTISEIDKDTISYQFHEPLGVVGQIIPFNFPLLMAAWKIAPAIAAGNVTVVKPASPTPWSILKLMELIEPVVPAGVINVVNGPGAEVGMALASSKRIAKVAFTGETATGRMIMSYAAQNLIPSTTELGGKSPNIFFEDILASDDEFFDKAIEGLVLYAFNKGEVCTCPSRALIQASIYEPFIERCARAGSRRSSRATRSTSTRRSGRRSRRRSSRRSRAT